MGSRPVSITAPAASTAHNVDQRSQLITFGHSALGSAPIELEQHGPGSARFRANTSTVIWPEARRLACHPCSMPSVVQGKRVVEVGAGLGLVGLVAWRLGAAETVLTDCAECLAVCESNVTRALSDSGDGLRGDVSLAAADLASALDSPPPHLALARMQATCRPPHASGAMTHRLVRWALLMSCLVQTASTTRIPQRWRPLQRQLLDCSRLAAYVL